MFAAFRKKLTDGLDAAVGKYAADGDLLEGAMAACAMIAASDGQIEAQEKAKTADFIRRHEAMRHFDTAKAAALFTRYAGEFDFDFEMGADTCLKQIGEVRGDEKRVLVMRVALAIAKSDGEFEPAEKTTAGRICDVLGLNRADFGL
jgi:tellurite resistance protein TerB